MLRFRKYFTGIVVTGALALPSLTSAQTSTLSSTDWSTCWGQEQAGVLYTTTMPTVSVKAHVPVGAYGQHVRVRFSLYKMEHWPFQTAFRQAVNRVSNWWYGVATATSSPMLWYEYALPLAGGSTLKYTGRYVYAAKPAWGLPLTLNNVSTSTWALVQYEWVPLSWANQYSTAVSPDRKTAWATGNCYWQWPTSWQ
jgi:hypothetical protein